MFRQCMFLAVNFDRSSKQAAEIDSIDKLAEVAGARELEGQNARKYLTAEEEFWGHLSNLQAWVEHDYDTRILHSNMAFPLLKALAKAGDAKANRVLQAEIESRIKEGFMSTLVVLVETCFDVMDEENIQRIIQVAKSGPNAALRRAFAGSIDKLPASIRLALAHDRNPDVRANVGLNTHQSEILAQLAADDISKVRASVARNSFTPYQFLNIMAQDERDGEVLDALSRNPSTPEGVLTRLSKMERDRDYGIVFNIACNPSTPPHTLLDMAMKYQGDPVMAIRLASHSSMPLAGLQGLADGNIPDVKKRAMENIKMWHYK